MSLFPVIGSIAGIALGAMVAEITNSAIRNQRRLIALAVVIVFFGSMIFGGFEFAGLVMVLLLQVHLLMNNLNYETFFSNPNVRNGAYVFLVLFLPAAYAQGTINAEKIIDGRAFMYAEINGEKRRFIGHAGNHMFFFSGQQKSLLVQEAMEGGYVELKYHPSAPKSGVTFYNRHISGEPKLTTKNSMKSSAEDRQKDVDPKK